MESAALASIQGTEGYRRAPSCDVCWGPWCSTMALPCWSALQQHTSSDPKAASTPPHTEEQDAASRNSPPPSASPSAIPRCATRRSRRLFRPAAHRCGPTVVHRRELREARSAAELEVKLATAELHVRLHSGGPSSQAEGAGAREGLQGLRDTYLVVAGRRGRNAVGGLRLHGLRLHNLRLHGLRLQHRLRRAAAAAPRGCGLSARCCGLCPRLAAASASARHRRSLRLAARHPPWNL